MSKRTAVIPANLWIAAIVLVAVVVGLLAVMLIDRSGDGGSKLGERFDYGIEAYEEVDPSLLLYDEAAEITTAVGQPRAVAVGPDDRFYVAGEEGIQVFAADGTSQTKIPLPGVPSCLAVGGAKHVEPGRLYVGIAGRVEVLAADGTPQAAWEVPGERARLTSIAVAEEDVFVADCLGHVVLRFNTSGEMTGRVGGVEGTREVPGLAIPSPFFDVGVSPDQQVWLVNPAALRLQAFDRDGNFEMQWGKASAGIDGFFGCCNPAHFAILPDGRFVTAEKGLVRVKVYSPFGDFLGVVAGPRQLDWLGRAEGQSRFDHEYKAVDVAADSLGRVLVLDLAGSNLRIYVPKAETAKEANDESSG